MFIHVISYQTDTLRRNSLYSLQGRNQTPTPPIDNIAVIVVWR